MALIPIITIPDPVLRKVAAPVPEITDGVRQLLMDMAETMYNAPGIGLAAPQINISQRLIVMDCGKDETPELLKMIHQVGSFCYPITTKSSNSEVEVGSLPNRLGFSMD